MSILNMALLSVIETVARMDQSGLAQTRRGRLGPDGARVEVSGPSGLGARFRDFGMVGACRIANRFPLLENVPHRYTTPFAWF